MNKQQLKSRKERKYRKVNITRGKRNNRNCMAQRKRKLKRKRKRGYIIAVKRIILRYVKKIDNIYKT